MRQKILIMNRIQYEVVIYRSSDSNNVSGSQNSNPSVSTKFIPISSSSESPPNEPGRSQNIPADPQFHMPSASQSGSQSFEIGSIGIFLQSWLIKKFILSRLKNIIGLQAANIAVNLLAPGLPFLVSRVLRLWRKS